MELALYCPELGFYETERDNLGRGGDYYTSVSVGPLFGELLAFQFSRWLADAPAGTRLRLIEAGAHRGQLAGDILNWLQLQRPEVFAATEYWIVEPSALRRQLQEGALARFGPHVKHAANFAALAHDPALPSFDIILSNELLDAMPLRRFGWDAPQRRWFEWGVSAGMIAGAERFEWARLPVVDPGSIAARLDEAATALGAVMPDGFTLEYCPAAEAWWRDAAEWLRQGRLLAFDYGLDAAHAISPERPNGTVRAYRQHRHCDDVLADPGEQDITAHVDFGRIAEAGVGAGLTTDVFETQGRYLTRLAGEAWNDGSGFGEWDQKRSRQLLTLTHPQHLGHSFRVLAQSRR